MSERHAPWPADHAAMDVLTLDIPSCASPLLIEQRAKSSYVETGTPLSPKCLPFRYFLLSLDHELAMLKLADPNAGTTVWNAVRRNYFPWYLYPDVSFAA